MSANVYRHSDGYPDGKHGVPAAMARFFDAVEASTPDTRFGDPEYLAAKFIVWHAADMISSHNEFAEARAERRNEPAELAGGPLDFIGIGPCIRDHGDIEYVYTVDCSKLDDAGRPTVTWEDAT